VTILGVSPDSSESHSKFKVKYEIPFTLLSDVDRAVCTLYGVWGPKQFMGRTYDGVHRTTFVIDPQNRIEHVFENVQADQHNQEVLEFLKIEV